MTFVLVCHIALKQTTLARKIVHEMILQMIMADAAQINQKRISTK